MAKRKRRFSTGSVLMLTLMFTVLLASGTLLLFLGGGRRGADSRTENRIPAGTAAVSEAGTEPEARQEGKPGTEGKPRPVPTAEPEKRGVRVTAAGTLAIEKSLRQSCYASDSKVYDFTELLSLLKNEINGDLNAVFLENLLMEDSKVSNIVIPGVAADLLKASGFQWSLSGFPAAWDRQGAGLSQTAAALRERNIVPLGILPEGTGDRWVMREVRGIRIAAMQYTSDLGAATRKNMTKKGSAGAIPESDPEMIGADLAAAKAAGADVTIVFLHWGKNGSRQPDKNQTALARQIAELGADVIIGAGSRVAQGAEYLQTADGRQVLCAWSLGTLMSEDRSAASRIGGYLLQLSFERDALGTVRLSEAAYIPTYVWRYRQDSTYYYKCLAADRPAPDGMDSEQVRLMEKTRDSVQKALEGSPLSPR